MTPPNRSRGLLAPLYRLHGWYRKTPERALSAAYSAARQIEQIEQRYFDGKPVPRRSTRYSTLELAQFQADINNLLGDVRGRLAEFNASRSTLNFLNERSLPTVAASDGEPLQLADAIGDDPAADNFSDILERLRFIDTVLKRYRARDLPDTVTTRAVSSDYSDRDDLTDADPRLRGSGLQSGKENESLSGSASLLPRSILRTIDRIKRELDPEAEEDVVETFRDSKSKTVISLKFILTLILVPLLVHQLAKTLVVAPIYGSFWADDRTVFLNSDMEEEAFMELNHYRERLEFQIEIGTAPSLTEAERRERIHEKALEIADDYRGRSSNAIENVFADLFSFLAFCIILATSKREVEIVKSFIDDLVYGLSDSAKAFIIILFTDIFVGYHSPHGWEIILEGVFHHFGLPENRDFNFLFIATFPVILDTVVKYWIFRYLNRISPSAVATYRNMNE